MLKQESPCLFLRPHFKSVVLSAIKTTIFIKLNKLNLKAPRHHKQMKPY